MLSTLVALAILLTGMLAGCGRTGFPVPPDDYGIGMRLQAQKEKDRREKKEREEREAASAGQKAEEELVTPPDEVILPDMRPVGGR